MKSQIVLLIKSANYIQSLVGINNAKNHQDKTIGFYPVSHIPFEPCNDVFEKLIFPIRAAHCIECTIAYGGTYALYKHIVICMHFLCNKHCIIVAPHMYLSVDFVWPLPFS